jgi:hypothetical protein
MAVTEGGARKEEPRGSEDWELERMMSSHEAGEATWQGNNALEKMSDESQRP